MKLRFTTKNEEYTGAKLLAGELGIELTDKKEDGAVTLTVEKAESSTVKVSLEGGEARITYGGGLARFYRGLAALAAAMREGKSEYELCETPLFDTNGAMVDMSRNAVMNVDTVKFMLRKMALMGLNTFMLYTEDTYEIPERPYFGYMRGRYTQDEIRELDSYAIALGIELVPCIQMLGHLATHLRWRAAGKYKDTMQNLLVGADETYALIEDMLNSIASCFTSRRLHVGMDETHTLGTGASLDRNGYTPRGDLFFEHLDRICKMAVDKGFRPMMWSDMIIKFAGEKHFGVYDVRTVITPEIAAKVPKEMQLVFWDYYRPNESYYTTNIKNHRLISQNTVFAGGIWTWSGHCPHFSHSLLNTLPALDACRKEGVKEIFATIWHNGGEASMLLSLAALAWYADYDYKGQYDEASVKVCFENACLESYDSFMATELPELPHGGAECIARALTYNDPMVGLIDKHVSMMPDGKFTKYYKKTTKLLRSMRCNDERFDMCFEIVRSLSSLLENKADFGVRLKAAYDAKDKDAMAALLRECDLIVRKIKKLREVHRTAWMSFNKPNGWEVFDIRYGGMLMRFDTVKARVGDYLAGRINEIGELDADRLRIDGQGENAPAFDGGFRWLSYGSVSTASSN